MDITISTSRPRRLKTEVNYHIPGEDEPIPEVLVIEKEKCPRKQGYTRRQKKVLKIEYHNPFNPEAAQAVLEKLRPKLKAERQEVNKYLKLQKKLAKVKEKANEEAEEEAYQERFKKELEVIRLQEKHMIENDLEELGLEKGVKFLKLLWDGGRLDPKSDSYTINYRENANDAKCRKIVKIPQPGWEMPSYPPEVIPNRILFAEEDEGPNSDFDDVHASLKERDMTMVIPEVLEWKPERKEWFELSHQLKFTIVFALAHEVGAPMPQPILDDEVLDTLSTTEDEHALSTTEDEHAEYHETWPEYAGKFVTKAQYHAEVDKHMRTICKNFENFHNPDGFLLFWEKCHDHIVDELQRGPAETIEIFLSMEEIEHGEGFLLNHGLPHNWFIDKYGPATYCRRYVPLYFDDPLDNVQRENKNDQSEDESLDLHDSDDTDDLTIDQLAGRIEKRQAEMRNTDDFVRPIHEDENDPRWDNVGLEPHIFTARKPRPPGKLKQRDFDTLSGEEELHEIKEESEPEFLLGGRIPPMPKSDTDSTFSGARGELHSESESESGSPVPRPYLELVSGSEIGSSFSLENGQEASSESGLSSSPRSHRKSYLESDSKPSKSDKIQPVKSQPASGWKDSLNPRRPHRKIGGKTLPDVRNAAMPKDSKSVKNRNSLPSRQIKGTIKAQKKTAPNLGGKISKTIPKQKKKILVGGSREAAIDSDYVGDDEGEYIPVFTRRPKGRYLTRKVPPKPLEKEMESQNVGMAAGGSSKNQEDIKNEDEQEMANDSKAPPTRPGNNSEEDSSLSSLGSSVEDPYADLPGENEVAALSNPSRVKSLKGNAKENKDGEATSSPLHPREPLKRKDKEKEIPKESAPLTSLPKTPLKQKTKEKDVSEVSQSLTPSRKTFLKKSKGREVDEAVISPNSSRKTTVKKGKGRKVDEAAKPLLTPSQKTSVKKEQDQEVDEAVEPPTSSRKTAVKKEQGREVDEAAKPLAPSQNTSVKKEQDQVVDEVVEPPILSLKTPFRQGVKRKADTLNGGEEFEEANDESFEPTPSRKKLKGNEKIVKDFGKFGKADESVASNLSPQKPLNKGNEVERRAQVGPFRKTPTKKKTSEAKQPTTNRTNTKKVKGNLGTFDGPSDDSYSPIPTGFPEFLIDFPYLTPNNRLAYMPVETPEEMKEQIMLDVIESLRQHYLDHPPHFQQQQTDPYSDQSIQPPLLQRMAQLGNGMWIQQTMSHTGSNSQQQPWVGISRGANIDRLADREVQLISTSPEFMRHVLDFVARFVDRLRRIPHFARLFYPSFGVLEVTKAEGNELWQNWSFVQGHQKLFFGPFSTIRGLVEWYLDPQPRSKWYSYTLFQGFWMNHITPSSRLYRLMNAEIEIITSFVQDFYFRTTQLPGLSELCPETARVIGFERELFNEVDVEADFVRAAQKTVFKQLDTWYIQQIKQYAAAQSQGNQYMADGIMQEIVNIASSTSDTQERIHLLIIKLRPFEHHSSISEDRRLGFALGFLDENGNENPKHGEVAAKFIQRFPHFAWLLSQHVVPDDSWEITAPMRAYWDNELIFSQNYSEILDQGVSMHSYIRVFVKTYLRSTESQNTAREPVIEKWALVQNGQMTTSAVNMLAQMILLQEFSFAEAVCMHIRWLNREGTNGFGGDGAGGPSGANVGDPVEIERRENALEVAFLRVVGGLRGVGYQGGYGGGHGGGQQGGYEGGGYQGLSFGGR